jgi:oligopeptide/dipeptide ABC transporter ATP-binding protein
MYAGRIVETASAAELFANATHPYTRGLMDCMPARGRRGERLTTIPGAAPRPGSFGFACAYAPRCPRVSEACRRAVPLRVEAGLAHEVLCFYPLGAMEPA